MSLFHFNLQILLQLCHNHETYIEPVLLFLLRINLSFVFVCGCVRVLVGGCVYLSTFDAEGG